MKITSYLLIALCFSLINSCFIFKKKEQGTTGTMSSKTIKKIELSEEGNYIQRLKFSNDVIQVEAHYKDEELSMKNGPYLTQSPFGKPVIQGTYVEGERQGKWLFFHYCSGLKRAEGSYLKGEKDGSWTKYYDDGSKYAEMNYLNGKKVGLEFIYNRKEELIHKINHDAAGYEKPEMEKIPKVTKAAETFTIVEQMPTFNTCDAGIGGEQYMYKFIQQTLKYPEHARENGNEGLEIVRFTVDTLGQIEDIQVLRSMSKETSDESIRVIESMPQWNPGKQRGKKVNVYFNLPIRYVLR